MITEFVGQPVTINSAQKPKNEKTLIAFCGPAQVGKTTAANSLIPFDYVKFSFADPIRAMLRAIGVQDRFLKVDKEVPMPLFGGKTARYVMQSLGTNWAREMISPSLWIDIARHELRYCTAPIVIDDLRFDNEAEVVHELGGIVIELHKPGSDYDRKHASEQGISRHLISHEIFAEDVSSLQDQVLKVVHG